MRSYGIEVMHVSTDDHGEWRVNTMTEDGDISTTGTFYVTVAKEPTAIREGFIKKSGKLFTQPPPKSGKLEIKLLYPSIWNSFK